VEAFELHLRALQGLYDTFELGGWDSAREPVLRRLAVAPDEVPGVLAEDLTCAVRFCIQQHPSAPGEELAREVAKPWTQAVMEIERSRYSESDFLLDPCERRGRCGT
jgi:hypothetical protein